MSFAGKVVLVTGASSGIGAAAALKLASLKASLALFGRNREALEALLPQCLSGGSPMVQTFLCDVSKEQEVTTNVKAAAEKFGRLDVLVNCAGVLVGGATQDTTSAIFDTNFGTNTRGAFLMMSACIPFLEPTKGNIVNVSSINGMHSFQGVMAYCASKAALDQMTKCAAVDLAAKGIRVNSVNPGVTRTELQKRGGMSEEKYQAFLERSKVTHPLGRIAEPQEVAEAIVFLAGEATASFITGALLPVDGGRINLGMR